MFTVNCFSPNLFCRKFLPFSPLLLKEKESEEKKKFPKQKNCKI